jgi:uncharacterized protein with PQ loop repeat
MPSKSDQTIITEVIGIIAGTLSFSAGIPQVVSIFKNKSDRISPAFLYILLTASIFWIVYALLINIWSEDSDYTGIALIVFQSITFTTLLIIIIKLSMMNKK